MNEINNFNLFLQHKSEERQAKGLLRTLVYNENKVDFSSNDYFGFSKSNAYELPKNESGYGGTGSRSITGNCKEAEIAEKTIAKFHKQEAALIYNSGYMANVGLFSCIASKGDSYISDEYVHASIIDGMRLSHANRIKFKHNNTEDLEKKLRQTEGRKFVAIESVYSMDGDEAPLNAIAKLCKTYNALLIVDEAHATGIFGNKGEGLVCENNLENEVFACIYTFGKAIGLHGAAITGSHALRNYLINHSRSFIFTTALPPQSYMQINKAYALLPIANRKGLSELIAYFGNEINKKEGITFIKSNSPIQAIIIGDNFKAKALEAHLSIKGFFIRAILSPSVPIGKERLRVCLHAFNTKAQIDSLLTEIKYFLG